MTDKVTLPNFLIVGASRCGTTSLYYYLRQHPEIYMPPLKEPHFLSVRAMAFPHPRAEEWDRTVIRNLAAYKNLFADANGHARVGEASTSYLFHHESVIPTIKEVLGDVAIIIMLRNPIERAFSSYLYLKNRELEDLSFESALEKERNRITENYTFIWQYRSVGLYSGQVEAYLKNFQKVGVFFYDDLAAKTESCLKEICDFLGIDATFKPELQTAYNTAGLPKNSALYRFFTRTNSFKQILRPVVNLFYPESKRLHFVERIKGRLLTKPDMPESTKKQLIDFYRDDIQKLETILNTDLQHWLN